MSKDYRNGRSQRQTLAEEVLPAGFQKPLSPGEQGFGAGGWGGDSKGMASLLPGQGPGSWPGCLPPHQVLFGVSCQWALLVPSPRAHSLPRKTSALTEVAPGPSFVKL